MGWRWGPCHLEIKMVPSGTRPTGAGGAAAEEAEGATTAAPVLIEINAGRWNGEEFQPLAELCNGRDALEATLDAYLDAAAWERLPAAPPEELLVHGKNVKLVSS
eukprot:2504832-Prymnesium_polylepis.1